ncbi:MAG: LysM peptidoglycan-binding domain-containing protein [Firmicutes bacterium]|jgi:proteasome lid subunit RPN8/RPN11/LysM repeat protein|nr:LysM peptidoglycan-binding domain-containing protein [Bacillota bacterium]
MKVHIAQVVKSQIAVWARQEGKEIGGLLLGRVQKSGELIRRVRVEAAVLAQGAESVGSSIRLTPELVAEMTEQAKREYPTFQVVGWFHTHNGLGAFFSSYDAAVHKEYFPEVWQIALVFDPELDKEAIYVWQGQEIVPYAFDSGAEPQSLISQRPVFSRYRLVNPRRLLASIAVIILLVAAGVGLFRWRSNGSGVPIPEPGPTEPIGSQVQEPISSEPPAAAPSVPAPSEGTGNQLLLEGTKYTIQPNDNLWEISRRFYGHGSYFGLILEHNQIDDPRQLTPGQELLLPPKPEGGVSEAAGTTAVPGVGN